MFGLLTVIIMADLFMVRSPYDHWERLKQALVTLSS